MDLFPKKRPFRRLYRISMGSALIISLPIFIMAGWLIVDSYLEYRRFATIACRGRAPSFNLDIMHLYLRNAINGAYLRAISPEMPNDDVLPTLQLAIDRESLARLNSDLPKSGKSEYYRAYVKYKDSSYTVKARYMGVNHWHWLYTQKSWRIKTKKSKLIEETRKINVKNPRSVLTYNESIAQDLAREIGLIAPRVYPLKFIQNNVYMGVYLFCDKIDESIIRLFGRMPGSVYDGDNARPDPATGVSLLWKQEKWWTKSASRNADQKKNREDIRALIAGVNEPDMRKFYLFVKKHLNNDAYAAFLALDNVTACMHHDFHHNHKFYFDPSRGKFEPISWDVDYWHLTNPSFDAAGNPLLNKWKRIPELDLLRKRKLYKLMTSGAFSPKRILAKVDELDKKVRPALHADVYRDRKYPMTRSVLKFDRFLCAPFDIRQYDEHVRVFKKQIYDRAAFLRDHLGRSEMIHDLSDNGRRRSLRLLTKGASGRRITGVRMFGTAEAATIHRDVNRNLVLDESDVFLGKAVCARGECFIPLEEEALPGYRETPQKSTSVIAFGTYSLTPSPLEYDYLIETRGGEIGRIEIASENIVTGAPRETPRGRVTREASAKTVSLHPWDLPPRPEKASETLGPGEVFISKTTVFPEHVTLKILPGATLRLAENVSIFCHGKVIARGAADNPIRFTALDPNKPWGVFALQGKGADGSVFEHCVWEDGSIAKKDLIDYLGMVSMHDVDNATIRNCRVGRNHLGDDAMHLVYCDGFTIDGCSFTDARSDALDIDISGGRVISSSFQRSGNDGLDLMTSRVEIRGCVFEEAGDKGISIGEKSDASLDGSVITRCKVGVEVKDRSELTYGENLIRESETAINLYKKNWRYNGGGVLYADVVYAVDCGSGLRIDKHSTARYHLLETLDPDPLIRQEAIAGAGSSAPDITNP